MHCEHGCHVRIAELEARVDERDGVARREREDKEKALAACQFLRDRLEFIEPMYCVVRRDNESLWAAIASMRTRLRGEEAGRAEAEEERDMYRGAAAEAQSLRGQLAAETDARLNAEDHCRTLISHLRVDPRTGRPVYRNGPNTPSSARKKAAGEQAATGGDRQGGSAGGRGGGGGRRRRTVQGRPGGRPGHQGHGRSYKPTRTVLHNLPRNPDGTLALRPCRCGGGHWELVNNEGRIVLDLRYILECIKSIREMAKCTGCGATRPAVDGLPAKGSWSRPLCGFGASLRAHKMSNDDISDVLTDMAPPGIKVTKSNVVDSLGRICDASRPYSEAILSKIKDEAVVYEDETMSLAVPSRHTAERAEKLAVAGSISSALIASVPPSGLPAVLAVDPSASSWPASAALDANAALGLEDYDCALGIPPPSAEGPGPPASAPSAPSAAAASGLEEGRGGGGAPGIPPPRAAGPGPPASVLEGEWNGLGAAPAARPRCPASSHPNGAAGLLAAALAAAGGMPGRPAAAAAPWPSLGDAAAAAAAGISAASLIDAAARTAAGIGPDEDLVGAAAEACLRDGSADRSGWVWVFAGASGLVAYRFGLTRAGDMHDKYMAGFGGILVSDRFPVYRSRFEADGRLQLCWAHELRDIAEAAIRPGSSLAVRRLYRDVLGVFRAARDAAADAGTPRTRELRAVYEKRLDDVLDRYRGCGEEDAEKMVAMLDRDKQSLFTFLEHEGVEPTNNRAERALRYIVLLRKIFGQIKGGRRSMERWGHFATCVMSWRAQGKSVMAEVARIM